MRRFPADIMCTCVVPWDERGEFIEPLFVDQVHRLLELTPHLYIFGTAGEGHAVTDSQFLRIAKVFQDTMARGGAEAIVGVISLSLPTILERIGACCRLGVRNFQISLPSWGPLTDKEVGVFFREVCGRFTNCRFLHYNLLRTKRLITPEMYGELAAEYPNLVATKNSTDSIVRLRGLLEQAPQLQHFVNEEGYVYASELGECGLLASVATTNHRACRQFFDSGRSGDRQTLFTMQRELAGVVAELIRAAGLDCHIDSAYDKLLWKLHDERFPLRLLAPYQGATDDGFRQFVAVLRRDFPRWLPDA